MIPPTIEPKPGPQGRTPSWLHRLARLVPVAVAGVILAVGLSIGLLLPRNAPGPPPLGERTRVSRGSFRSTIVLTGSLAALRSEEFKVPITDTYRVQIKWMVKEGDSVKPGDPVVRFDTASLASSIETARESLKSKLEEKAQKEAEYANQKFELEVEVRKAETDNRQKTLDASIPEDLESRYEHDRKQLEKKKSDHALAAARTNRTVKLAEIESQIRTMAIEAGELEAKLWKLEAGLDGLTLVAGTGGAVIYGSDWSGRKFQVSDTVYATQTVATVPDLTSLRVEAWISETRIQRIKPGQEVDLMLDAYPDRPFKGTIADISESAEPVRRWGRSNWFRVEIAMERLEPEIMKPGMSVRCDVRGPELTDVLLVPLEMTAFDGKSFRVRPAGGEVLELAVQDYDDFTVAAGTADNPSLKAGTALAPVGDVPDRGGET